MVIRKPFAVWVIFKTGLIIQFDSDIIKNICAGTLSELQRLHQEHLEMLQKLPQKKQQQKNPNQMFLEITLRKNSY